MSRIKSVALSDKLLIAALFLLPFSFYLYQLFPEERYMNIFGTRIDFNFYYDFYQFAYNLFYRLMFIGILFIWIVTSPDKWRNLLLILVLHQFYKSSVNLCGLLYENELISINNGFLHWSIAMLNTVFFALIVYWLKKKLGYGVSNDADMYIRLSKEFAANFKQSKRIGSSKRKELEKQLKALKTQRSNLSTKDYLAGLLEIKKQL